MMYLMYPLKIFMICFRENSISFKKITKYIIKHKMMCDYRLQANALEFSKPLVDKGVVTKEELETYIDACNKDAEERNLPYGAMIVYK